MSQSIYIYIYNGKQITTMPNSYLLVCGLLRSCRIKWKAFVQMECAIRLFCLLMRMALHMRNTDHWVASSSISITPVQQLSKGIFDKSSGAECNVTK